VRIQEVSSLVPSYPVQWTRYNSLQEQCWLSIFGVEDFGDFEFQLVIDNKSVGWGCVMSHNTPVDLLTNFQLVPGHSCHSHLHSEIPGTYVLHSNLDALPVRLPTYMFTLLPRSSRSRKISTPDPVSCYSISLTLLFYLTLAFLCLPFMYHQALSLYIWQSSWHLQPYLRGAY